MFSRRGERRHQTYRIAKRVADGQVGQVVGTRYISAGNTRSAASWQTIEEYNEGAQMLTTSYIHGNYIDEVLSLRKDTDGSGNVRE